MPKFILFLEGFLIRFTIIWFLLFGTSDSAVMPAVPATILMSVCMYCRRAILSKCTKQQRLSNSFSKPNSQHRFREKMPNEVLKLVVLFFDIFIIRIRNNNSKQNKENE